MKTKTKYHHLEPHIIHGHHVMPKHHPVSGTVDLNATSGFLSSEQNSF